MRQLVLSTPPLSPRKVFRVNNSNEAEQKVHRVFAKYRVRHDREFFIVEYSAVCKIIEECLRENKLFYYKY